MGSAHWRSKGANGSSPGMVEGNRLLGVGAVDDVVRGCRGAGAGDAPGQVAFEG